MSSETSNSPNQPLAPIRKGDGCVGQHIHNEQIGKIIMECKSENFWYRVAEVLGFVIGKIPYMGACRKKFQNARFHLFGDEFPQGFRNFPFGSNDA